MAKISVIIPVLNEGVHLAQTLKAVTTANENLEILVVDGGSRDETVEIAIAAGVKVILSEAGRALQMNAGAAISTGDILLFLHGDTRLPTGYEHLVQQILAQSKVVAGAFDLKIDRPGRGLRWVEWGVKWRSRGCQLPYGDQAIFLTRDVFQAIGGFPVMPIMEDFVLIQQLKKMGKVAIAPATVTTSPRRWQTLGVFKTTLINQIILIGYFLGISPKTLAQWYRGLKSRGNG